MVHFQIWSCWLQDKIGQQHERLSGQDALYDCEQVEHSGYANRLLVHQNSVQHLLGNERCSHRLGEVIEPGKNLKKKIKSTIYFFKQTNAFCFFFYTSDEICDTTRCSSKPDKQW
jgi:hypothetical protein